MEVAGGTWLGWVGFALAQSYYLPQTIKILKKRDVSGLSLLSWCILAVALFFYLLYSIYQHDIVFIVGNAAGTTQSLLMIALIMYYGKKQRKPA